MKRSTYNVYCDESCHLENDGNNIMVLGCLYCNITQVKKIHSDIQLMKKSYSLSPNFEIKWGKVSQGKVDFYQSLVGYVLKNPNLSFRAVIATNKSKLNHDKFLQDHDDWYYKMYYLLLRQMINTSNTYNMFIDIKDTRGVEKIINLKNILNRSLYSACDEVINKIQLVRSNEVGLIQLTDLLIGALSYCNRNITSNKAKLMIIKTIQNYTGYSLNSSTRRTEDRFNIFVWTPRSKI